MQSRKIVQINLSAGQEETQIQGMTLGTQREKESVGQIETVTLILAFTPLLLLLLSRFSRV